VPDADAASTVERDDAPRRLAVRVTNSALRYARSGHPWIYSDSVNSVKPEGRTGDLAVIFDNDRQFAAIGLYDADSPLRIRVLHAGRPMTIDAAWFGARIDKALDRRRSIVEGGRTDGYRCIHGENDGLPGLVVDRYASTIVIKLDTAAWLPHLDVIVALLQERLDPDYIVLRASRTVSDDAVGASVIGGRRSHEQFFEPVLFQEQGLMFEAYVLSGQKTGHFLDQRDNRRKVGALAKGADVLDVFCATGGFTVHAAAGGARSVHSVDLSPQAIDIVAANLGHNRHMPSVKNCKTRSSVGDAFEVMDQLRGETHGVVVVDPPSFAHKQADVDRAMRAYIKLTSLAVPLVRPGGVLVQSSCSSRVTVEEFEDSVLGAIRRSGRLVKAIERTGHPIDHPIGFDEGAYLKTLFVTLG
jgi:23S rRNA (cytosine1962-C5)-methyltransferase